MLQNSKPKENKHIAQLANWVESQLQCAALSTIWKPLNGDAGFRKYFRLPAEIEISGKNLLAVWSPPDTEANEAFIAKGQWLQAAGISSPEIFFYESERGFFLLEDLGEQMLYEQLSPENAQGLYCGAFQILALAQQSQQGLDTFGPYSEYELMREMRLFDQWFLAKLLNYALSDAEYSMIEQCYSLLCRNALEQPQRVVHRDFHSRNLVYREGQAHGVIDYQDAVVGAVTYDLVSLLRDCYVEWPESRVDQWLNEFWQLPHIQQMAVSQARFSQWFDLMGLQRHIKVLGIFSRLYLRDNKPAYLNDLPLVLKYFRRVLSRYPALSAFHNWFEARVMPLVETQHWMKV